MLFNLGAVGSGNVDFTMIGAFTAGVHAPSGAHGCVHGRAGDDVLLR
jgi:hypothetical protein